MSPAFPSFLVSNSTNRLNGQITRRDVDIATEPKPMTFHTLVLHQANLNLPTTSETIMSAGVSDAI
jgi:hypothetical protein